MVEKRKKNVIDNGVERHTYIYMYVCTFKFSMEKFINSQEW